MNGRYGKYHDAEPVWKANPKDVHSYYVNSITRRTKDIA